jgi:hypothetical protein
VLGPALLSSSLPALNGYYEPLPGQHVQGPNLLAALAVLGAAPKPLAKLATRVFTSADGQGLTVAMKSGLLVYFGDASRPHAKWLSLARVLADPSSAGASYVDVRVPERPAAGFAAGVAPPEGESTASTAGPIATPESTVAALATGLTATTGGGAATAAGPTPAAGSTAAEEATTSAGSTPAAGSTATEASSTATTEASAAPASTSAPEATVGAAPAESTATSEAETAGATQAAGG